MLKHFISTIPLHGRNLNSLVAKVADNFEMPFSCARHPSDFCGVCSNVAPVSSSVSSVSKRSILSGFLYRSDLIDLPLLIRI
jgi:hypothetical protein